MEEKRGIAMMTVRIRIKGLLDTIWSDWLNGLDINHTKTGESVVEGVVADSVAFHGMLNKLCSLGLELLSVEAEKVGD